MNGRSVWDELAPALAFIAWVATAVFFHTSWTWPSTPIIVAVPVLVAATPLLLRGRARQAARIAVTALLFVFVLLAAFTAGILFLPAAIAMLVGAARGSVRSA